MLPAVLLPVHGIPIHAEKRKGQVWGWDGGLNKKATPELRILEEGWTSSMGKGVKGTRQRTLRWGFW